MNIIYIIRKNAIRKIRILAAVVTGLLFINILSVPRAYADEFENALIRADVSTAENRAMEDGGVYSAEELNELSFKLDNKAWRGVDFVFSVRLSDPYNTLWESGEERRLEKGQSETVIMQLSDFSNGDYTLVFGVKTNGVVYEKSVGFYCSGKTLAVENQGINEHLYSEAFNYTEKDYRYMKNAGFSMFRSTLTWGNVEKSKGIYKIPEFVTEKTDKAKEYGNDALVVLGAENELYCKSGYFPTSDDAIAAYAKYCGYVAGELKGKVKYYEVLNEPRWMKYDVPNLTVQLKAQYYVKLLKAAYTEIKKADPDAFVLGISESDVVGASSFNTDHIKYIFDEGGADYMDGLSVHTYPGVLRKAIDEMPLTYTDMIDCLEGLMPQNKKMPIWITETGYSATKNEYGDITDELQAAYLVRIMTLFDRDGRADMMMKYQLRNLFETEDRDAKTAAQGQFGMIHYDENRTIKPNYRTATAKNKLTYNMKCVGDDVHTDRNNGYKGYSVYKYEDNSNKNKKVYVLWSNGGNEYNLSLSKGSAEYSSSVSNNTLNINLPVGEDENITVRDAFGNIITDMNNLKLDFWPKYIICGEAGEGSDSLYVSAVGHTVSINGKSVRPNQNVTVKISAPGEIDLPGGYVNQCKSDSQRNFSFTTELEGGTYLVRVNNGNVREREITIKGQTPAETGEMNVSVSGNTANISGKSVKPNQNVTVRISLKGSNEPPFVYVNQCVSGDDRSFSFTAELEKGEYTAFVNNGNTENTDFEIKDGISLKKNGITANSLGGIQPTDKLEAEFYLENAGEPLYALAALYKDDRVVWTQREEIKPNSNKVAADKLTIPASAGIGADKLVCFVWNGDLKPYFGVRQFN